ncbi:prepilin-type N-terminal cleavage/methylation domain-containing protein [Pseudoalteromonas sp. XMcav1-K]|uniref:type IV pilus modification PilV family protein n=1 Tax=Pseudoalteromonas sp. XMcav1-K TaxID=3374372 RepID=UPI003757ABA1
MSKIQKYTNQAGFSLVEVMVALVVSSFALLGMAAGQLQSLKYATNSFDYTLSLLQANNAVEQTWVNLCDLQKGNVTFADVTPDAQFNKYTIDFENNFNSDFFRVGVSWSDKRINDNNLANRVEIEASFPDISGSC